MDGQKDNSARVLIADDQPDVLEALSMLLRTHGYQVQTVNSPPAIVAALKEQAYDLLLMDLNFTRDTTSGREGLDLLAHRETLGDVPIVVMTGWGTIDLAVEAMQHGVGDFVQKPWDNARLLETLRRQIEQGVLRRRARQTQAEDARRVQHAMNELRQHEEEIEEAHRIQERMVPLAIPRFAGYEIDAAWRPARSVGGDYYDVVKFSEDRLGVAIGDVTGKGIPAALLMSNLQATVRGFAGANVAPVDVCDRVNRVSLPQVGDCRFITFFYGLLHAPAHRLAYVNAGHNPPLLVHRDGSQSRLRDGGPVLGLVSDWQAQTGSVDLAPGDRLILFTDGITESADARGEEFMEERLAALATTHRHMRPKALIEKIMAAVREFNGDQWNDDATLLVLGREGDAA
ncbi:MAG TPA: SpoIIE family protein phosphatase [Terriglobia bacterium]|nr:SpoIIE family protein phosphatase [Terriglobia bacterium]